MAQHKHWHRDADGHAHSDLDDLTDAHLHADAYTPGHVDTPPCFLPNGCGGDETVDPARHGLDEARRRGIVPERAAISRMLTLSTPSLTWVFAQPARSSSSFVTSCPPSSTTGAAP
jgi:hypothetical protein